MNNNLCSYYSLSNYKIGDYNKHQTLLSLSNTKTRKAEIVSFI